MVGIRVGVRVSAYGDINNPVNINKAPQYLTDVVASVAQSTLCLKNDTDIAHYNYDVYDGILIILADVLPTK